VRVCVSPLIQCPSLSGPLSQQWSDTPSQTPSPPPLPPDMLQGYRNSGARASAYFSFSKLDLVSSEKKGRLVTLWSNLPFLLWQPRLYVSKNEHYPPVLGAENHMQSTWMLTWTHVISSCGRSHSHGGAIKPERGALTHWVEVERHPQQHKTTDNMFLRYQILDLSDTFFYIAYECLYLCFYDFCDTFLLINTAVNKENKPHITESFLVGPSSQFQQTSQHDSMQKKRIKHG